MRKVGLNPFLIDPLLGVNFYPHTDSYERGEEVVDLTRKIAAGSVRPVMSLTRLPLMIPTSTTNLPPAKTANGACWAKEREPQVLDCTFFDGFPYADLKTLIRMPVTVPAMQETARMLREIEVTLIPGPDHDRAVMPEGTVLEGRDEEELARSIMDYLVPGIFGGFEPPSPSESVHISVIGIEEELLLKFVGTFLSGVRPGTTTISESAAFKLMVEDVMRRIYDLREEWYLWEEEMDEAGYDPDQFLHHRRVPSHPSEITNPNVGSGPYTVREEDEDKTR